MGWLRKAVGEKLLREYVLYWQAQASARAGAEGYGARAVSEYSAGFSGSAMTELTVTALAQTALDLGKGERGVGGAGCLPVYSRQTRSASLRAQAHEKISAPKEKSPRLRPWIIWIVYYHFPLNDEAKDAGAKIPSLRGRAGRNPFLACRCKRKSRARKRFMWPSVGARRARNMPACCPNSSDADHQRARPSHRAMRRRTRRQARATQRNFAHRSRARR